MGPGDGELVTRFLWIACDFPWDSMRLFNGFDGSENCFFFLEIHNCWEYPQILYRKMLKEAAQIARDVVFRL
jgi:hypothetical protein